jgi:adenine/guanine phosphoribosyltransferase-like PRPP-binding protein
MKFYLPYDQLKNICLCLADDIKKLEVDSIVAVSRGGLTPAHIIAKYLRLPCDVYFPDRKLLTVDTTCTKIVFIEDLVAEGRTYRDLSLFMSSNHPKVNWTYIPILVDGSFTEKFKLYGFISNHWVVFPYEEFDKTKEGDRGLFRLGDDCYDI